MIENYELLIMVTTTLAAVTMTMISIRQIKSLRAEIVTLRARMQ